MLQEEHTNSDENWAAQYGSGAAGSALGSNHDVAGSNPAFKKLGL